MSTEPGRSSAVEARQLRLPRVPRHAIARDGVELQLNRGAPLSLVHAPLGFGKTIAVVQWLRRHVVGSGTRVHWVDARLDAAASRSLWHLVRPLPPTAEMDRSPPGPLSGAAALRLAEGVPTLLVVDSAEALTDGDFLTEVVELVARYDFFRAVVCSRTHEVVGLEDLHRIDVIELDESLLRFKSEETSQVLAAQGIALGDDMAASVHHGLGGWPTLVGRAVKHLRDPDASPLRDRVAADRWRREVELAASEYLAGSFLPELLTSELLDLAIRAAVLREVTPAALDVVLGASGSGAQAKEDLRRAGLLTAIGMTASFPDAIRRALLLRGEQEGGEERTRVRRDVVSHHLAREEHRQAVEQALEIGDPDLVAELIADHWFWLHLSHGTLLEEALRTVPAEVLARHPRAAVAHEAIAGHSVGDPGARPLAGRRADLVALGHSVGARQVLLDSLTQMTADRVMGRIHAAGALARRLAVVVESARATGRTDLDDLLPMVLVQCGVSLQLDGDLGSAATLMAQAHPLAGTDPTGLAGRHAEGTLALANILLGHVATAREWSRLHLQHPPASGAVGRRADTAGHIAELLIALEDWDVSRAGELVDLLGRTRLDDELFGYSMLAISHFALMWGQPGMMLEGLIQVHEARSVHAGPETSAALCLRLATIDQRLALGHGTQAAWVLRALPEALRRHPSVVVRRARLALLSGSLDDCVSAGFGAHQPGPRHRVELGLLQAAAHRRAGEPGRARDLFDATVRLAAPMGLAVPFALLPRADLEALVKTAADTDSFVTGVLDRGLPAPFPESISIIGLTEREHELLEAIDADLSNEEMANAFFVSTNTIKTQLRALYRKLGATSRGDVLYRARVTGTLE